MVEHVYRRAMRAGTIDQVYIATPDAKIFDAARGFGAPTIMTSPTHTRAVDRVAEAARGLPGDVVMTIQGDEPLVDPRELDLLGAVMKADAAVTCANLVSQIVSDEEFNNPNQIKVVCDRRDNVLYMSRQPIPSGLGTHARLRQLGVIAFRKESLAAFAALPSAPLEVAESIDMLRALEHGFSVRAVLSPYESFGVDIPDDLRAAEARLVDDPLMGTLFPERDRGEG